LERRRAAEYRLGTPSEKNEETLPEETLEANTDF